MKEDWNIKEWDKCINIEGTKAFNIIKKIGIEKYKRKRIKEGKIIWKDWKK
jgi:hypothetical protein